MKRIIEITALMAHKIYDDPESYCGDLFILKDNSVYIAIDNSTGNAWTEEFYNREIAEKWLRGEINTDAAHQKDK